tara:strand:+ start:156 stop:623 length:468 start_codon:yes stop_codon:yes gene_type:complete
MGLRDRKSKYDRNVKGVDKEGPVVGQSLPSDGDYFNPQGTTNSPFNSSDHMVDLLKDQIVTGATYDPAAGQNTYNPASFIGNLPAPDGAVDTWPDLTNAEGFAGGMFQRSKEVASQAHESSLGLVPGFDSNSPYQDRPDANSTTDPVGYENTKPN